MLLSRTILDEHDTPVLELVEATLTGTLAFRSPWHQLEATDGITQVDFADPTFWTGR